MNLGSLVAAIKRAGTIKKAREAVGLAGLRQAQRIGAIVISGRRVYLTEVGYELVRAVSYDDARKALELRHLLTDWERT